MVAEPCLLYAIRFASDNPTIRCSTTGGTPTPNTIDVPLLVSAGTDYYLSGNGTGADLVTILGNSIVAGHNDVSTFVAVVSATNILSYTVTLSDGTAFEIQWAHANTTVDESIFGFANATISGLTAVGTLQTRGFWTPSTATRAVTWVEDTRNEPITNGVVTIALDGSSRGYKLSSAKHERMLRFAYLDRAKILTDYAVATEINSTFEEAWQDGISEGRTVLVFDDRTDRNTYDSYRVVNMERPWTKMDVSRLQRYELELRLREP